MAQTGYSKVQIYSSSTATNTPSASNLTNDATGSELAINITDGKLFYKDNSGSVQVIGWKTVPYSAGGTGNTTAPTAGAIAYGNGTQIAYTSAGTVGQALISGGSGTPTWGSAGATISTDTSTATPVYPLFAETTSGAPSTIYISNPNYLYTPSTGLLQAPNHYSSNGITINGTTVSSNVTLGTGKNGFSVGPITINSGVSVTLSSGQRWVTI